jgi:hypothetical protein
MTAQVAPVADRADLTVTVVPADLERAAPALPAAHRVDPDIECVHGDPRMLEGEQADDHDAPGELAVPAAALPGLPWQPAGTAWWQDRSQSPTRYAAGRSLVRLQDGCHPARGGMLVTIQGVSRSSKTSRGDVDVELEPGHPCQPRQGGQRPFMVTAVPA